ncbi:hypothetical protein TrVE_jg12963 [Triparma verrucosa]|uniref:SH3 domain-containing protein n=1 Tax=Triparma verrucosa TaxID=1606542 RepID=A0A9W7B5W8_9STRA|nr:hypothetical protein TrVE_jg12963 [Triparma verrucosa]
MSNWLEQNAPMYLALYDFKAEEEGEMSMTAGVEYQLSAGDDGIFGNDDDIKDGWILLMDLATGESGFVPIDYVKKISQDPPKGVTTPRQKIVNPDPTVMVGGKAEAVSAGAAQKFAQSQNLQVDTGTPLSLQDLAGSSPTALPSPSPPASTKRPSSVRRLSDPRLTQRLLETMDSGAGPSSLPPPSSPSPSPSPALSKRSSGSSKRASAMKARMSSTPSKNDDKKLFSSVKSMERAAKPKPYNPKLVSSIRAEDYATLYSKNAEAHKKLQTSRGQLFGMATKMTDSLAKKIGERNQVGNKIEKDLKGLQEEIEKERVRLLQAIKEDQ